MLNRPPCSPLLRKVALTGFGAFQNRGELFLVELRQENNRVIEICIWGVAVGLFGLMFLGVLTAAIIMIFPDNQRVYAAGGFALLYLIMAGLCLLNVVALARQAKTPFNDSMAEFKKDREWLESLK